MPNFFQKGLAKIGESLVNFSKGEQGEFNAVSVIPNDKLGFSQRLLTQDPQTMRQVDFALKKPSDVTFGLLRQISKRDALIRICVNAIKKSVSQARWYVDVKDGVKRTPEIERRINEVTGLFERQNDNAENMRLMTDVS